ncbi:hypothetical protein PGLA_20525 [Paenibacillus glacialis]|uniref:Transposase IS30-like HTH domain-containing protein n=1 Tax=Paenibacillus glacialis TaxID=494026 RepID=A0A168H7R7_9BACL|nr:helix-turn-helix domain-containing protein [Paenibacillus glacialis]OAB37910.1 hypothetical protein PGLA_20525 [Paenibacillus glacialis]
MGYTHFSITERSKLELLLKMRWSTRAIAKELGRHHASIAREIKRGRFNQEYVARSAQQGDHQRRAYSVPVGKYNLESAKD